MIIFEDLSGSYSPARIRTPAAGIRSTSALPMYPIIVRDLISAAQELLLDRYWMCFADPGKKPAAWSIGCIENTHILQKSQLQMIAREFSLLRHIPIRKTPDSLTIAYVRLLHELLHKAERTASKNDSIIEGATHYLAIYAYLGEVPESWIMNPASDFSHETSAVARQLDFHKTSSVIALARAYFGNGNFDSLFHSTENNSQKK